MTYALDQCGERRDRGSGVRGTEHASEGHPRTINVFAPKNVDGARAFKAREFALRIGNFVFIRPSTTDFALLDNAIAIVAPGTVEFAVAITVPPNQRALQIALDNDTRDQRDHRPSNSCSASPASTGKAQKA